LSRLFNLQHHVAFRGIDDRVICGLGNEGNLSQRRACYAKPSDLFDMAILTQICHSIGFGIGVSQCNRGDLIMPSMSRSALVPYTAEQMYRVVNDTQDYPSFVPWCNQSEFKILSDCEKQATLHFARGAIKTSFTTRNTLSEGESIAMELVDGPFKQLHGVWRFTEIEDLGSRVELSLEFELSNPVLKLALESFFNQICDRLVSSFVGRAEQIYN